MERIKRAWRTARDGTRRTLTWAGDGIRDGAVEASRKVRSAFSRGDDLTDATAPTEQQEEAPATPDVRDAQDGHGDPEPRRKIAIFAAVGLIVAIWIGWTAYIWSENGSNAGVGVLISWPAVFAALALISAPFVGGALLVRHHRPAAGITSLAGTEVSEASASSDEDEAEADGDDEGDEAAETEKDEDEPPSAGGA